MTAPAPVITAELRAVLRQVKLGRCLDTLRERFALAKSADMAHADFLELVLADEVTRRETTSASRRSRAPGAAALDHGRDSSDHRSANTGYPVRWTHQAGGRQHDLAYGSFGDRARRVVELGWKTGALSPSHLEPSKPYSG